MNAVTGQPRTWLRLEGLAVLVASVLMYRWQRGSWTAFLVLFLVPDLSTLGYLAGPAFGADAGETGPAMGEQRVHQGAVEVAGGEPVTCTGEMASS